MTDLIRRLLEVFLAGVLLVVGGTLLEPVLAIDIANFGWILIGAGVVGGIVAVGLATAQVSNNLS